MKKPLLTLVAMVVMASSAHAIGGIDLSVGACPGNQGAIGDIVTLNCASGNEIVVLGTWAPAEDYSDLVALDGIMEIYVPAGLAQAGFWDFDPTGCNWGALTTNDGRPATGCDAPANYLDCWSPEGSGTAVAPYYPTGARGNNIRLSFTCYRPSLQSVTAGQNLFGVQVIIDGRKATEAGGSCGGCAEQLTFAWIEASPGVASGDLAAHLDGPTGHYPGFGSCIGFEGPAAQPCAIVPVKKRTWGQLKSLYR